jgi:UDP-N-acetylmuramate dehydrogenase
VNQRSLADAERRWLAEEFGERLEWDAPLAPFTSARIGGPTDALVRVGDRDELVATVRGLWNRDIPFRMLGGGSNVLIADGGFRGVILLNQADRVEFSEGDSGPEVLAESGASFGSLGRRTVQRGWAGMEWAATVPGTVGGAVVGNAGAHGGETSSSLKLAEILHQERGVESWSARELVYDYRTSWLKQNPGIAVVLSATFRLAAAEPEVVQARLRSYMDHRRQTQPPGASWGSMFKNPLGDFAGRLIEASGLKRERRGAAQVSEHHANFFVNLGGATASDVWDLIQHVRDQVAEKQGVELELEIERIGDWEGVNAAAGGEA